MDKKITPRQQEGRGPGDKANDPIARIKSYARTFAEGRDDAETLAVILDVRSICEILSHAENGTHIAGVIGVHGTNPDGTQGDGKMTVSLVALKETTKGSGKYTIADGHRGVNPVDGQQVWPTITIAELTNLFPD
jgi:hypothetical protein